MGSAEILTDAKFLGEFLNRDDPCAMQELEEGLVRVIWMSLENLSSEEMLGMMERFRDEQGALLSRLAEPAEGISESACEVLLYLGAMVYEVAAHRGGPERRLKMPVIESTRVERCFRKRSQDVGAFLGGRKAQAMPLAEALEALVAPFELPQLPLLGHATEGLLVAYDEGDLSRQEVELCFVRLLALLDGVDQVVKS